MRDHAAVDKLNLEGTVWAAFISPHRLLVRHTAVKVTESSTLIVAVIPLRHVEYTLEQL